MPGVRRACEMYMVPNLPAPMMPTRSGLPAAWRWRSLRCRFIGRSLRSVAVLARVLDQAIVGQDVDRREITISDPCRTLETFDRVVAAVERQIDHPTRPRRQVRARGVY